MPRPLIDRVRERYGPGRVSGLWRIALSETPGEIFAREVSLRWEEAADEMLEGLALLAAESRAREPLLSARPPLDLPHENVDDPDPSEEEAAVPSRLPREPAPASGPSRFGQALEPWALEENRRVTGDSAERPAPGRRESLPGGSTEPRVSRPRETPRGAGPPFPRGVSPWLEEEARGQAPREVEETLRDDVSQARGHTPSGPISTGSGLSAVRPWDASDFAPPPRASRAGEGPPLAGSAADLPPLRGFPPEFSSRTGYPVEAEGAAVPRGVRRTADPAAAPRPLPARRDRDAARDVLDQVESLLRERGRREDALREWERTEF